MGTIVKVSFVKKNKLTEKELNKNILEEFNHTKEIHGRNNKLIHHKSISNFIDHLVHKTENPSTKNNKSNREELGRIRKKELLNDYLVNLNKNPKIDEEISKEYFHDFIQPLGNYMSSYYGFTLVGNGVTKLILLIIITISLVIDYSIYFLTEKIIYFTILSVVIFIVRRILKFKQRKIFGYRY
ncbi:hypothetical protein [Christiangramia sabulilitoris]|uniref:Uncharacterized protein n=1 Tax=Christiangramia sabulilitoris TaxID=2583991 RepID=A0A550I768_9FLAO|nr:hypothetical protein [Christiangramia sabulilitoris]TRO66801.1 hypothetical protein FGM01_02605 [Christiangramia sabulilitoris]